MPKKKSTRQRKGSPRKPRAVKKSAARKKSTMRKKKTTSPASGKPTARKSTARKSREPRSGSLSHNKNPLWSGRFLEVRQENGWEYVARRGMSGIVGIVPITVDRKVVLIEQYRPPVNSRVIELPAGLAGDHDIYTGESLLTAAKRELLEETGYEAAKWTELVHGYSSAGLTDESLTFFLATELRKTQDGGGDEHENITVHEVPWDEIPNWITQKQRGGTKLDLKLFAGLYCASISLL